MNFISQDAIEPQEATESGTAVHFRKRGVAGIDAQVGARLRLLRQGANVPRRDMAAALGISVQQLSKYETGNNRMSVGFLYEAALYLRIPVQSLLVEIEEEEAAPARTEEEEAMLRFVMRNIRSTRARKGVVRWLEDTLRTRAADSPQGDVDVQAPLPVAGD